MSAPNSDDENSNHQMYAPKSLREHTRIPRAPQLRVDSPRISPSQPQGDRQEEYGLPYSEGGLENEVRRRLHEREAVPLPQLRRRRFSAAMLIGKLAIAAACIAVLIVMFTTFVEPLWQSTNAQLGSSDRPTANKAPTGSITGMAAVSGAQQPNSVQAQPAQLAAFARHFEENPVQGVTGNEVRFGISAPFSGAAKELGQNMKLGIDAAFHVANAKGGVHGRQLRLVVADDGYEPSRTVETMKQLYEQRPSFRSRR